MIELNFCGDIEESDWCSTKRRRKIDKLILFFVIVSSLLLCNNSLSMETHFTSIALFLQILFIYLFSFSLQDGFLNPYFDKMLHDCRVVGILNRWKDPGLLNSHI